MDNGQGQKLEFQAPGLLMPFLSRIRIHVRGGGGYRLWALRSWALVLGLLEVAGSRFIHA